MKVDNPIKVMSNLRSASKKAQAIFLAGMEDIMINDPRQAKLRKLFLDCINDFTRTVATSIVGEVEDLMK